MTHYVIEQTENLKKVHERFDEMETHEQIIKNTLDGDQLSELEASLGIAFKVDIEVYVYICNVSLYD